MHVPLTYDGPDATFHLIGADELAHMTPSAILINTARGEVVDNTALLETLTKGTIGGAVLDVWEREPAIDWDLLDRVTIGTPHIAGYSSDGKINGTVMVYHACCRFWGIEPVWVPPDPPAAPASGSLPHLAFDANGNDFQTLAHDILTTLYDLPADHARMRDILVVPEPLRPQAFDGLRRDYPHRREFAGSPISVTGGDRNLFDPATNIGNPRQ